MINSQPIQKKPINPEDKKAIYDYLMSKDKTSFIPSSGDEGLKSRLSSQAMGDEFAVTPLDQRFSEIASNPNRQTSLTDSFDFSRSIPSIEKKTESKKEMNPEVKSYLQKKITPKTEEAQVTPTPQKKEEGDGLDLSYLFQGLGVIGEGMKAGSGGQSDQMGMAKSFQGMRDTRDAKLEQAKMDDPNNEKAVEYRKFIQSNFNPKLLKEMDLNKMSLRDMQGMYGQFKDREQSDLQRQMMMAKAGGGRKTSDKLREEEADVKSFKDSLRDYQKSVKDIGLLDLSGEGKARAESQRADLLLKLKNLEKTGALDQGMINIANELLPEASYTRDGKVDAKINSYVDTIDRNYTTKARAMGYEPQMYQSEKQLQQRANQESQALDWARNNPKDPRSKAILQRLGY